VTSNNCLPAGLPPSAAASDAGLGDHRDFVAQQSRVAEARPASRNLTSNTLVPAGALCAQLMEMQAERLYCIKLQSICDRKCEHFVARRLGYSSLLDEAARTKLFAQARIIIRAVEAGGGDDQKARDTDSRAVVSACSSIILRTAESRRGWDAYRSDLEARMRELARQLPAWPFVEGVRGFSDLGLAVVVGETGDLSGYANPGKVWKRLGLAVIDGNRQGNPGPGATAEDWVRHGYRKQRRAEVWAFCSDVMFRHQWRGEKNGTEAHALGPYGEAYGRKKAEYLEREWTKGHAHNAATHYMTKEFIKDLWKAWRRAERAVPERASAGLPAVEPTAVAERPAVN
jgi:hypothetical protein